MESATLFKLLGNPQRLAILRRLMANQATLTQLGEVFNQTPAHIRHHLKALEQAGLVEFVEARPVQGGPEKYYRATRRALFIQHSILPEVPTTKIALNLSSLDTGLRLLAEHFSQSPAPIYLQHLPFSSLDGLIALRQGLCQISAAHLYDPQSGDYNRSFVRHIFPGQSMALVQIYSRHEGLLVQPGNPLGICSLDDLSRPGLRFAQREPGSGVRQWLDSALRRLGLTLDQSEPPVYHSHNAIARAIQQGRVDCGIAVAPSARQFGLDFIPLYEEPYELVLPLSLLKNPRYAPFFEYLSTNDFRTSIRSLGGYIVPQNALQIETIQS